MTSAPIPASEAEKHPALRGDQSRIQLVRFLEALPVGVLVTDRDGKAVFVNGAAESLLGYDQTSPVGCEGTPETASATAPLPIAQALRGETAVAPDIEVRSGGKTLHLEATAAPVFGPGGAAEFAITTVRDVTGRLNADRRQAAQHAATRVLAECPSLDDALPRILETLGRLLGWDCGTFWVVDREARAMRAAAAWSMVPGSFEQFLDLTATVPFAKGVGLPWRVWNEGTPVWLRDVASVEGFDRGVAAAAEGLVSAFGAPVALGGEVLGVVEFFGRHIEDPDPELLRLFATIGSQIAQFMERDSADRALRASEELTHSVVENMLEGLIVVDERGVIESVNPAAERIFAYHPHELVGQNVKILLPASRQGSSDAHLSEARERAMGRVTEWEGRRRGGEIVAVELSLYEFITPAGRRIAGHVRDVSGRRALDRMKKEFVATVSHELRTPLTSIRGSLSLLAGGALGDLPDEAKDVIEIAERNTVRLITLINDILDLERLDAGKMEMSIEGLDLLPVLERSQESVRALATQEGIRLEAAPTTLRVLADADRLVQVLVNLLSNAIKFSPKGAVVVVSAAQTGEGVEIRVTDQGRGIPVAYQRSIFERFQQVETSDSRRKGGSGLGLAISRAIVEQSGGSIGVDSEPGKGSSFWVRLPAPPVTDAKAVATAAPAHEDRFVDSIRDGFSGTEGSDVLLVDDDQALVGVMARQILREGVAVRTASTVGEALIQAWQQRPALVVLDLNLPDADGADAVTALRGVAGLQTTPLLVYTGRDLSADERAKLQLGPTRFLTKSKSTDSEFRGLVLELLQPSRLERVAVQ
jgi:PAS domain S-box-containing protein